MRRSRFALVNNVGPNNLRDSLRAWMPGAQSVDIGVAFITRAGLNELLPSIQQVAQRGRVRVLTGIYQAFTEPEALRAWLRVQKVTNGALELRVSSTPHFHWKVYLIQTRAGLRAVVGSSNVTGDGLVGGAELNVIVEPGAGEITKQLRSARLSHTGASRPCAMGRSPEVRRTVTNQPPLCRRTPPEPHRH